MRAIILAAGSAKRLRPLTDDRPKCMLEVGGRPIFEYQLEALQACGVDSVVAVVGWHREKFEPYSGRVDLIFNEDYAMTNSLYSFWLCRERLDSDALLLNGDVLFSEALLRTLVDHPAPDALLLDAGAELDEEAMKVEVSGGRVAAMSKEMPPGRAAGENLGIIKLSRPGARALWDSADQVISSGELRAWLPHGIHLICGQHPFEALECGEHPWVEVDTAEDLKRAEEDILPRIRS